MSEQKNQQKQPPKRATSGIFAILMALLLFLLGQQLSLIHIYLRLEVPISFTQAALGAEIDVPTLDGSVK